MNLKNVEVYKNILNYIIKEQNNAFDTFWIICVLFYSFYFNYFTISFEKFLGNMLDLKVYLYFFGFYSYLLGEYNGI